MFRPDPRRRGEIDFVFAKKLSYERRQWLIVGLLAAGFAVQALLGYVIPEALAAILGLPLLLAGSLLAVVKGFSNIPDHLPGRREWRGADRAQLENVIAISQRSRSWDQSALDITCITGFVTLVLVGLGVAGVGFVLLTTGNEWLAVVWVIDAAVLLVPHWVTGVRRILTNDPLVVKIRHLLAIMDFWRQVRADGEEMIPQMQVRSGRGGEIPCDAKLILRIGGLGDNFLGVQTQVVLNRVQGRDYPYLYCVLVARGPLEMHRRLHPDPPGGILAEPKTEDDVDIIVIRNRTSKTSGYHTNPAKCRTIFACALAEARKLSRSSP